MASLAHLTDEELLAAIHQGDEASAAELVERYNRQGILAARRDLGGDVQAAQDVVQTVWQELTPRLLDGSVRNFRHLFFWLVRRRSIDVLRRQGRWHSISTSQPSAGGGQELADVLPAPGLTPEEEAVREEQRRAARQGLEQLSPRDRAVVWLRAVEGLSNRETARLLVERGLVEPGGDLEKRVENYYYRALERYRNLLQREVAGGGR